MLWSNTMVSVLARQNPFDRMISERYKVQHHIIIRWVTMTSILMSPSLCYNRKNNKHVPDILIGLWKHGWILWTLSFLSTWSNGDRSKNVNMTSDLEYCWREGYRVIWVSQQVLMQTILRSIFNFKAYLARHVDSILQKSFHLVQFLFNVICLFDFHQPWNRYSVLWII